MANETATGYPDDWQLHDASCCLTVDEIMADPLDRFSVEGKHGMAWYAKRRETVADEDTEWTGIEEETGRVVMTMVGDDTEYVIDPSDVTRIEDDEYCPNCGSTDCAWR